MRGVTNVSHGAGPLPLPQTNHNTPFPIMKIPFSLTLLCTLATLPACGGSDDPPAIDGTFVDSAVEGLEYVAGSGTKTSTDANGRYTCKSGETVTFSLGGVTLGSASCGSMITPLQLAGVTDVKNDKVMNRLLALQLLDEDNNPANGIRLSAEVKAALATRTLDFGATAAAFDTAFAALLATLPPAYRNRSVDADRRTLVREHFENTLASQAATPVEETVTQTHGAGAVSVGIKRYQIQAANSFHVPYEGTLAAVKSDFPNGFLPSFGSGLAFKGTAANGALEFYGLTDRGPNGDGPNVPALGGTGTSGSKIFPSASFSPSIGIITLGSNGAVLSSSLPIRYSSTLKSNGLPIPPGAVGNSAEIPVVDALKYEPAKADFSANGLDTEAIVVDKARGVLWVSDEYGPFILKIDTATGTVLKKYQPGTNVGDLPPILLKRRANRGMEGLTLDIASGKLHGFLQSPLSDGKHLYSVTGKSEDVERFARFARWVEFDPSTETSKMYAYPLDGADYDKGRTGNAKLGDVVSLGNGKFIVIEQGTAPSGKVANRLMLVQIGSASDISAAAHNPTTSDLEKSSMAGAAVNGASWANVVTLKKTQLLDLNAAGWLAEKAEGLTLVDDFTLALTNDNDFGLKTIVTDPAGAAISGADITACKVDASGAFITDAAATGCTAGNSARVARGADHERPARLWLLKFSKKLVDFSVPG